MEPPPCLSIVIPSMGRATLTRTLDSLALVEGFDRVEVLVVGRIDDRAVAGHLARLCRQHPRMRHLEVSFPTGDSSAKKNAGWRNARAEFVAFLDDDVIVPRAWLAAILEVLRRPGADIVSGPAPPPNDATPAGRLGALALSSAASGHVARRYTRADTAPRPARWSDIIGCNMAWRRAALEQIDGFDTRFWPGEEMLAAYQATRHGRQVWHAPSAWLWHEPRPTFSGFLLQMYRYGATRIRLIRAGVRIEPATLAPAVMVLVGLILPPAAFFWRPAAILLATAAIGYSLPAGLLALLACARSRRLTDLLLAAIIPGMHIAYGIGQWRELLRPGQDFSAK